MIADCHRAKKKWSEDEQFLARDVICSHSSFVPLLDVPHDPQDLMEEYEELREEHYAGQEERHYLTFEKAQSKRKAINFEKRPPAPAPLKPGVTVVTGTYELDDVLDYIDWNPFFQVPFGRSFVLSCLSHELLSRGCCCDGSWSCGRVFDGVSVSDYALS